MSFPKFIQPENSAEANDLSNLIACNNVELTNQLLKHGALLFRGFKVADANTFERVSAAGTPKLLAYTGGGSPRKQVEGNVYTSTEYPSDQPIPLHCEESYFPNVPRNIWFFCETAPTEQGQTPLGCMRQILDVLDPTIVETFKSKGVRYIYNLHGGNGFGRGWKDAFQTEDRDWISDWLDSHNADYKWNEDLSLHVDLYGPALRKHTLTGNSVWGNQVVNWHVDALPPRMAQSMRRVYKSEDKFPKHATYGDGSPIPTDVINHILECLRKVEQAFNWEKGDILWCDNEIIAHGRRPFKGDRRILVALS